MIRTNKGTGLVEVLVATFIFSIILSALITASNSYFSNSEDSLKSEQAAYLAEDGVEAVKTIRDISWTNISSLSTTTNYYLYLDLSSSTNVLWRATTTATSSNPSFTRVLRLADVQRDVNGRIVSSGGTVDPKSKQVTVSLTWLAKSGTTTKSIVTYVTSAI